MPVRMLESQMLEKVNIFDFFELGYVIIIIGDDVSLYFKSHLEVK